MTIFSHSFYIINLIDSMSNFYLAFLSKTPFDVVFIYCLAQVANIFNSIFASIFLKKTGLSDSSLSFSLSLLFFFFFFVMF